ncbi:MAG: hypothetical protein WAV25_02650 [Minisyncoccia bacterium]
MGIKSFFTRQILKSKMKGVPEAQQEKLINAMERNPEFFKMIGEEIEAKKKAGKSEMEASMEVMRKHQAEFQKLL